MNKLRNTAVAVVSTVALGAFALSVPTAQADDAAAAPCADQQAPTDRAEAYRQFRGRDPDVKALLAKRGFPAGE